MMSDEGKLEKNPHTWVRSSNIIFIDQPVGVGFSYADFGEKLVRDTLSFSVRCHFISPYSSPSGLLGSLGVGREGRGGLPLNLFRTLPRFPEE